MRLGRSMRFPDSALILFLTADLLLVTPIAIDDFIDGSAKMETPYRGNVFWAVIAEASFTGPYQKVKKGYNRFKDLAVCHGNLLLMTPSLAAICESVKARRRSTPSAYVTPMRPLIDPAAFTESLSYVIGISYRADRSDEDTFYAILIWEELLMDDRGFTLIELLVVMGTRSAPVALLRDCSRLRALGCNLQELHTARSVDSQSE